MARVYLDPDFDKKSQNQAEPLIYIELQGEELEILYGEALLSFTPPGILDFLFQLFPHWEHVTVSASHKNPFEILREVEFAPPPTKETLETMPHHLVFPDCQELLISCSPEEDHTTGFRSHVTKVAVERNVLLLCVLELLAEDNQLFRSSAASFGSFERFLLCWERLLQFFEDSSSREGIKLKDMESPSKEIH